MALVSSIRKNCLPGGETEVLYINNAIGPITFQNLSVVSPTNCMNFFVRIYKNGILVLGFPNDLTSSEVNKAINLICEKSGNLSVTVLNNDTNPHTFEPTLT